MNEKKLNDLIALKLIKKRDHPYLPLSIYNYSDKCSYEGCWNEYTLMCRGLVLDSDYNIVARPFPKFFNLGEEHAPKIPNEPFIIEEKMDGSLIIITKYKNDELVISSRGSFVSDQAQWAKEIIENKYPNLKSYLREGFTYLYELIHPENRIVVDYGNETDLYLLAVIDNETGKDLDVEEFTFGPPLTKKHNYNNLNSLPEEKNSEGYVVRFLESDTRLKIKNPEYLKIHRIRFNLTKKKIWELLKYGHNPLEQIEGLPDEFYEDVENMVKELENEYNDVYNNVTHIFNDIEEEVERNSNQNWKSSRKDWAIRIQQENQEYRSVLFALLDEHKIDGIIWKMIRPTEEKIDV